MVCASTSMGSTTSSLSSFVKPGKGPAYVRSKLKNVSTGRVIDKTWNGGVKVEEVRIERRPTSSSTRTMVLNFMHPDLRADLHSRGCDP